MTNHPHRKGPQGPLLMPALIADIRAQAGLTQPQCAQMTCAGLRTWKHWEAGTRAMPLAAMELWCLAILAGGHRPLGEWIEPWVRRDFVRLFERHALV